MPSFHTPARQTPDTLAAEQHYQDNIIGKRLPTWLRSASADRLAELGSAMRQSLRLSQQLKKVLSGIQGIDSFARSALEKALQEHYHDTYDVQAWRFVCGHREPVINQQPVGAHLTEVVYRQMPLIEAALQNFTGEQTTVAGQPKGNRLLNTGAGDATPPHAIEFARLCRELDLGGQYQRHLDSVLQPETDQSVARGVSDLLANTHRYCMLVDAYEARLKGTLSEAELQLVAGLVNAGKPGHLDGDPVVAKQLRLLGCRLEQIVVLDVIDQGWLRNTTRRVLMHVPGDPNGAWSVFESLRKLANELGRRLRSSQYQSFFSRFVRRRDSQHFFSIVIPAYADLAIWANISLDEHMRAYPTPLFGALATARIQQIKDDATMIAVPVNMLDREVQRQHDERLAAEGWALISLAGLFVPIIGAGLLAITAWQLLKEVYHGVQAWHEGDTDEALDHLLNVAADLAMMTATAAGITAARSLWARSTVVDALVPGVLEDGTCKLWNQDLTRFRQTPAADAVVDSHGVYRLSSQAWIEMDGHHYAVIQRVTDGRWQMRPQDGFGPLLCHNNAGAWRMWCEQPSQWHDTHRMVRRFGGRWRDLDDRQIDHLLNVHGLDADHLRAMHVNALAPDAVLLDSVTRIRLVGRIADLTRRLREGERVGDVALLQHAQVLPGATQMSDPQLAEQVWHQRRHLFQRVYDSMQNTEGPGVSALRRVFPSLHERAASELLRGASAADRRVLLETTRVPLRLAEAARARVLRVRTARVYEALLADTAQSADLARVALGMLKYLPGSSMGPRWRLFEGYLNGPELLSTEGGAQMFGLIHHNGTFQRVDAQGAALGDSGELFEVMAAAYDQVHRDAMGVDEPFGEGLRHLLGQQALLRRQDVNALLSQRAFSGWFRPPLRQVDGRIGYPLSGRRPGGSGARSSRPAALFARVRTLYPSFSDTQVLAWITDVGNSGLSVDAELNRLNQELETLESALYRWQRQALDPAELDDRTYFRTILCNCWQRMANVGPNLDVSAVNYRFTVYGASVGALPELPQSVSFAHVFELALLGMELRTLPDGFLHVFTNLRMLELSGNRLTRLPQTLMHLPHLRELDLFNNRIVLDAPQAGILAHCEALEYVNLSFNPLGRTFSLSGLSRLRRLHLRHTQIDQLPEGLLESPDLLLADLRENRITQLPEDFYRAPSWLRRIILLADNPLTAEHSQRLEGLPGQLDSGPGHGLTAETPEAIRQCWLDAAQRGARDEMSMWWECLEREPGTGDFIELLGRLLDTADFHRDSQACADRVFTMLKAMHEHTGLREELLSQLTQNLTCQDSVALSFSNLELRMLVWQAQFDTNDAQQALLHLGEQLWRLDEVDRIALQDIQARRAQGGHPDEVEVGLAYRLALRDALDLPAQPSDMLFRAIADLEPQVVAQVQARVQEAQTPERVGTSLVARDFWREHLLRVERERFETIDAPFHDRLAVLMETETVPEGERVAQMNRVHDERREAQRALMLEMTLELLREGPGSPTDTRL